MEQNTTNWVCLFCFFGQVVLSGDFVPHLEHGAVVSRPLRPQRSQGSTSNLAARGSLSFQLMLRRGGESLASEFVRSAITVEVLAAKGLPPPGSALESGTRWSVGGTGVGVAAGRCRRLLLAINVILWPWVWFTMLDDMAHQQRRHS